MRFKLRAALLLGLGLAAAGVGSAFAADDVIEENSEAGVIAAEAAGFEESEDVDLDSFSLTNPVVYDSGTCGDEVTWSYERDYVSTDKYYAVLRISGTGEMDGYTYTSVYNGWIPWSSYKDEIAYVIIEDGVTNIGQFSFYSCTNLREVSIADSVTSIGNMAFAYCENLQSVSIPAGVESISIGSAFQSCNLKTIGPAGGGYDIEYGWTETIPERAFESLSASYNTVEALVLPEGLTSIPDYAFDGSSAVKSLTIPDSVTSIGYLAISGCTGLTEINLPAELTYIGVKAFSNCTSLTSVTMNDKVTTIDGWAFYQCYSLKSVIVPDSVTSLGDRAFAECTSLEVATLSANITEIEAATFNGCSSLKTVNIPDGVTSIGDQAFYNCSSLESIYLPEGITQLSKQIFYGCSSLTSFTVPDGVTYIGQYAFTGCTSLKKLIMPESVTNISANFESCPFETAGPIGGGYDYEFGWTEAIPGNAFNACSTLTSVIIPGTVTSVGYYCFFGCEKLLTAGPIGGDYNIQFGWTEAIPDYTFIQHGSLLSVYIPDGITSIGRDAFKDCDSITTITLPDSMVSIGEGAFFSCDNLSSVTVPASVTSVGSNAFTYALFETAGPIGGGYDYEFGWTEYIPDNAFHYCNHLISVDLPDTITYIGERAFMCCYSLESVYIPYGVTDIYELAFYECDALKTAVIPDSVTYINWRAFESADYLDYVYCYKGSAADDTSIRGITEDNLYYIGDVNFDKDITLEDAAMMAKFGSGIEESGDISGYVLDYNYDGEFDILDAAGVLRGML